MLAGRAEILETPVRFYGMSPAQVRRTTVTDGVRALWKILWWRLSGKAHGQQTLAELEAARAPRG